MDAALAGLVVVLAFMAASFVARNTDVWIHLAAGKRLFAGQYVPGSDPFSYSGADRTWVNHSWLVDAVSYLLYGEQGKVLVIVKAVLVALAFATVIGIRRPRYALWPWAAVAGVAVLASAPYLILRPSVVSVLFLAVTLFLLFRLNHRPNSWRFPAAIGVTFWLWANSDSWFFIGPLALALLIIGDLIQAKLLDAPAGSEPEPGGADEPLGRTPDTRTLVKALGIGVLACVLNPHHVRVWELPFELVGASGTDADVRFKQLSMSPTNSDFVNNPGYGQNVNGLAYAVLILAGAAVLGFGPGRVRIGSIALWIGFAALSLRSMFAIPFFALVAVPLVAGQLNAFSARIGPEKWADPKSRPLLIGSSLGRVLCVLAVCAGCVLAYPGWLQPEVGNPVYARRFAWAVEPEPSLVNAAEQFRRWREAGALPAEARGVVTHIDLANYLAWAAPQEKVLFNARYNFHRPELDDYFAVRKGLGLIATDAVQPNAREATAVLGKLGAEYVALYAPPGEGLLARRRTLEAVSSMYQNENEWSPWYTDGRTAVFGWQAQDGPVKPMFAALRVDPVALAFGPDVGRLPVTDLLPPPPQLGWEAAFVRPPQAAPIGAAEAIGWARFKIGPLVREERRKIIREQLVGRFAINGAVPGADFSQHQFVMRTLAVVGALRFEPNEAAPGTPAAMDADASVAVPILALRAARRAIAENPDHPDPYFALSQVLSDKDLPLTESERALGIATALRQCLDRLPTPDRYRRGQFEASPAEVALKLAQLYLNPRFNKDPKTGKEKVAVFLGMPIGVPPLDGMLGQVLVEDQGRLMRWMASERLPPSARKVSGDAPHFLPLDSALELLKQVMEYVPIELAGESAELVQNQIQMIEGLRREVESAIIQANEFHEQARGHPLAMIDAALRNGLTNRLLEHLNNKDLQSAPEVKELLPRLLLLQVAVELGLGHIETANMLLEGLSNPEAMGLGQRLGQSPVVLHLKMVTALTAGNYKAAGELHETINGGGIGAFDAMPPPGPNVPQEYLLQILAVQSGKSLEEAKKVLAVLLSPPVVPMTPLVQSLQQQIWQNVWSNLKEELRLQIRYRLQNESAFFFRRGALSLLEGDIPSAKQRFQQATRKPPKGWNLPNFVQSDALRYLRLIEQAEKRATP